jgi:mRNA-degrading endonuclease toxin of MazEF toxin-antitoxin module
MSKGDVLLVELPIQESGREQAGRRPAIAVQAEALRFTHTLKVEPSRTNGLTATSVLLVFQIRAIDQARIVRTIGMLEKHYMAEMDEIVRRLLGV